MDCGNQASFQVVFRKQGYLSSGQLCFISLVNKHYKQFHNTFNENMWFGLFSAFGCCSIHLHNLFTRT